MSIDACRVDVTKQVPQALCMCTTRELVAQNLAVLRRMAKYTQITSTSTAEDGEDTAGARGRRLTEQVGKWAISHSSAMLNGRAAPAAQLQQDRLMPVQQLCSLHDC